MATATAYQGSGPASAVPGQQYPAGQGGGSAVPDSYFTESRKGEINELRTLLRGFSTERDPAQKRNIIKKVIAYMTLGIDVSRLFTEMMLAIETRDLVIKKMIYLYLTNYARTHPELAQMCTNTLQKDCGNEDPMVRGLALRALAGLNLHQMLEYIVEPVRRSLTDHHAYVRKTAVMGVLKIYHLDPAAFEEAGFVDTLYDMLRDPDASVVANVVIVLNEVMQKSPAGGMAINRAIMLHLLNRIHEFNEFAKVQILELVPRYIPASEEEGFQIMNLLDPVLRTADSGATMATIKAFLSLAEHLGNTDNDIQRQIVERIKAPVVTQISSGSSEVMYALLHHVHLLTDICPGVFDDEYRQFYVRFNEPSHVKYLKVSILPRLANPDTAPDIVTELAQLVHDAASETLARLSVRSMGRIACGHRGGPGAAEAIARRLVDLLDTPADHISSEAAAALTLLVRQHPALEPLIAPPLVRSLKYVTEPAGRAAILYLLGVCGHHVAEAPYALEKMIDNYDTLTDPGVKTALLTATVQLFVRRPPELQRALGRLLKAATDDVSSQDLHDRALLYYRLLRASDPTVLERVLQQDTSVSGNFSEEADDLFRAELMQEFNSLSVIYNNPSVNFIAPKYQVKYVKMPENHPLAPGADAASVSSYPQHSTAPVTPAPVSAPPAAAEVDLLGFGGPPEAPAPAATQVAAATSSAVQLNSSFSMTGDEYQTQWGTIPDADAVVQAVPLPYFPANTDQVEQALLSCAVLTMASGELDNEFKFYLYAQDTNSGSVFFIQSNIDKASAADPLMIVTVKVVGGNSAAAAVDGLLQIMRQALNA